MDDSKLILNYTINDDAENYTVSVSKNTTIKDLIDFINSNHKDADVNEMVIEGSIIENEDLIADYYDKDLVIKFIKKVNQLTIPSVPQTALEAHEVTTHLPKRKQTVRTLFYSKYKEKIKDTNIKELDPDDFEVGTKIAGSALGVVFLISRKSTAENTQLCAKVLREEIFDEKVLSVLTTEINAFSKVNHPCLLKLIGYSLHDFHNDRRPVLYFEYMAKKSLGALLEEERHGRAPPEWNSTRKQIVLYGIAVGMLHLHSNGVLHRDLKPENVLLDENLFPKITDYGISKIKTLQSPNQWIVTLMNAGFVDTPIHMAPESIEGNEYEFCDQYSFGILMYQIVTKCVPFSDYPNQDDPVSLLLKIVQGRRPVFKAGNLMVNPNLKKLIEKCWNKNTAERPTFEKMANLLKNEQYFISEDVDVAEMERFVATNGSNVVTNRAELIKYNSIKPNDRFAHLVKRYSKEKGLNLKIDLNSVNINIDNGKYTLEISYDHQLKGIFFICIVSELTNTKRRLETIKFFLWANGRKEIVDDLRVNLQKDAKVRLAGFVPIDMAIFQTFDAYVEKFGRICRLFSEFVKLFNSPQSVPQVYQKFQKDFSHNP